MGRERDGVPVGIGSSSGGAGGGFFVATRQVRPNFGTEARAFGNRQDIAEVDFTLSGSGGRGRRTSRSGSGRRRRREEKGRPERRREAHRVVRCVSLAGPAGEGESRVVQRVSFHPNNIGTAIVVGTTGPGPERSLSPPSVEEDDGVAYVRAPAGARGCSFDSPTLPPSLPGRVPDHRRAHAHSQLVTVDDAVKVPAQGLGVHCPTRSRAKGTSRENAGRVVTSRKVSERRHELRARAE